MAEAANNDEEVKKKSPILKIILLVVLLVVVIVSSIGGTLLLTGFFDKKDQKSAEEQLASAEKKAASDKENAKKDEPKMVSKQTPEITRFEHKYLELERELLANLTNSRKVMQVRVALMTRYDERVFKNVKKHEFALRSVALDAMRKTTDPELSDPEFRKKLAEKIRQEINLVLEKHEDFGGIEEVYFTNFVVQ